MTKRLVGIFLILGVALVFSCAPAAAPIPAPQAQLPAAAPASAPAAAPAAPSRSVWEAEWEKTLEAAKKEGGLAFAISAGKEPRTGLTDGFKDNYGIRSESIAGTAGTLASKILTERRAGLYLWDVFIGGASNQTSVFKPGSGSVPLEPTLILPDVTDPEVIKKVWFGGELPWVDRDRHMIAPLQYTFLGVAINTTLVKPGEIKSYDDLLNPRWKGQIMLQDPTQPGSNSDGSLMPMLYDYKGEDWLRRFVQQNPVIIRDDRLAMDWLAHGKYPIYMPPRGETFQEFTKAGAAIAAVETQDIAVLDSGPSGIALIGRPPHPNAAKVFINYYLGKEGQTIMSRTRLSPSARLDVSTEGLPSWSLIRPGQKYWVKTREEILLKVADYRTRSRELFGQLLK